MFRMEPVFNKVLTSQSFGLGHLIGVMRKGEINSASMNIDSLISKGQTVDGGTFDMPPRTTTPEKLVIPANISVLGGLSFPENKIAEIVFIIFIDFDSGADFLAFNKFLAN